MPDTVLICASCVVKRSDASCDAAAALSFAAAASGVAEDDSVFLFAASSAPAALVVNGFLIPSGAAALSIDNAFTRLVMKFLPVYWPSDSVLSSSVFAVLITS